MGGKICPRPCVNMFRSGRLSHKGWCAELVHRYRCIFHLGRSIEKEWTTHPGAQQRWQHRTWSLGSFSRRHASDPFIRAIQREANTVEDCHREFRSTTDLDVVRWVWSGSVGTWKDEGDVWNYWLCRRNVEPWTGRDQWPCAKNLWSYDGIPSIWVLSIYPWTTRQLWNCTNESWRAQNSGFDICRVQIFRQW